MVATAAILGVPTPAFSTALAFYDGYRCARLPANLLQVHPIEFIFSINFVAEDRFFKLRI